LQQNPLLLSWLEQVHGLGDAGRARLLVAFELMQRYQQHCRYSQTEKAYCPGHPLTYLPQEWRCCTYEWVAFALVHHGRRVSSWTMLAKGMDAEVNFSPQPLLRAVLLGHADGFYLAHNHPNQDLSPSQEDLKLTEKLTQLSEDLGTVFLSHFIVSCSHWLAIGTGAGARLLSISDPQLHSK
jgi:DNA repair protein RadC